MAIAWFAISLAVIFFLGNLFFVVHGWWAHGGYVPVENWGDHVFGGADSGSGDLRVDINQVVGGAARVQPRRDTVMVPVPGGYG